MLAECPGEGLRIWKAQRGADEANGLVGGLHQHAGLLQPALKDIALGERAKLLGESAGEVVGMHVEGTGDLVYAQGLANIGIYISTHITYEVGTRP